MKGVLNKEYALARQRKRSHIYRLNRRTFEVLKSIKVFHPGKPQAILDIGAADGLMLNRIKEVFPDTTCVGIEYASDLISCNDNEKVQMIRGDALVLPFKDNVFDVVTATAIIEHVPDPIQLVREAFRILRKNGIVVITTPHPFWERAATFIGHLKEDEHNELIAMNKLKTFLNKEGFEIVKTEQFMISPIGMPFELSVEKMLKLCRLNFLLLNQKIVGRKI